MRSPAVDFDNMPGELPHGTVPEGTDYEERADNAIMQLNDLKVDHFTSKAMWRDLLALTHTFRCFYSDELICPTLRSLCVDKKVARFERAASAPRFSGFNWIDIDFDFVTRQEDLTAPAAGIVSVTQCPDGVWRIWMLRTWLECFTGYGHPDVARLPRPVNGVMNDRNDHPLGAIIIGAGQAGLSTAGRLQATGVSYILFEKTAKIGDVWRNRYDTLKLHTPKDFGPLPFGARFAADDPALMPAKRIGDNHEQWTEANHINVRTCTVVTSASYDDAKHLWTVTVSGPDGEQVFTAKNLVLCVGPGFTQPIFPPWATPDNVRASGFRGDVLHGSQWKSAEAWRGKRGVVVGTANTGHDVAEDMANAEMNPTMVQRGKTFVLPVEWVCAAFERDYNIGKLTARADRETSTYPNKISREITNMIVHGLAKANPERFDALEMAGFKVDRFGDLYACLYERFGGHYVDQGCSARIAKGDIKMKSQPIKGFYQDGLEFEDGSRVSADLVVVATGFNHDFRSDAAKIIGQQSADQMDVYGGLDVEGEMRGFARYSGRESRPDPLRCQSMLNIGLQIRISTTTALTRGPVGGTHDSFALLFKQTSSDVHYGLIFSRIAV